MYATYHGPFLRPSRFESAGEKVHHPRPCFWRLRGLSVTGFLFRVMKPHDSAEAVLRTREPLCHQFLLMAFNGDSEVIDALKGLLGLQQLHSHLGHPSDGHRCDLSLSCGLLATVCKGAQVSSLARGHLKEKGGMREQSFKACRGPEG